MYIGLILLWNIDSNLKDFVSLVEITYVFF